MSSRIVFKTNAVISAKGDLTQSLAKLNSTHSSIATIRGSIDPKILNRSGIGSRLAGIGRELENVENMVNRVKTFTSAAVEQYSTAESQVNKQGQALVAQSNLIKKILDERMASNAYEFYNNTIGRVQDLLHGLQYSAGAGIMHLLGFKYTQLEGLLRRFDLADDVLIGKYKLPLGTAIKGIENSKFHFLAKMMVSPYGALRYGSKPLSEHLYKRFANFFPSDIVNFSNKITSLKQAIQQSGLGFSLVKEHAGGILKTGLKVVKSNALLAGVITAGTEAVGATMKISENYSIYGGNVEKLKEENAKVVGEAVWKTGVVTATSVGGAVIGGAIGSLGGPVGTVVGATLGGIVGSMAGDIIAGKTAGWAKDVAVNFKDQIHSVTEEVRSGVESVKEGFNNVKNFAGDLLSGSKKFFGFG
ncbi:hypothetical protein [Bacillus sp. REN16]|uniref:hypothetical protein n=1 Tax=Bacillus sp. REN16 TaxID=2887296 RepID=UPI001E3419FF|nr:hypothetical protein [Bacillus sp. REN16]MCC3357865.1 hypothetical protein [Bacillus sp. REN16]